MKKLAILAMIGGLLILQSCERLRVKKEPKLATLTEAVTLKANETYTYVLPTDIGDDPFAIVTQAVNFLKSELTTNAENAGVFVYTPPAGFQGTEVVVISNEHEMPEGECGDKPRRPHHFGGHPPRGGERPEEHTHYNITLTITVEGADEVRPAIK